MILLIVPFLLFVTIESDDVGDRQAESWVKKFSCLGRKKLVMFVSFPLSCFNVPSY